MMRTVALKDSVGHILILQSWNVHNDGISPEDSILFKLIESLIGSSQSCMLFSEIGFIFRKRMWKQRFIWLPILICFAFFSGNEMTRWLFYFAKLTEPGSVHSLEVDHLRLAKLITGSWE
jgi:hypothetical protein